MQNKRVSPSAPLLRGAAQRCAACFVSTATAPHASPCHDRRSPRQRRQLPPVLPPCTYPSPRAAWHSCAREHTRALRAHVRHFSFFAFTSSPLCRKSLYDSRFGVKDFSKMLHRGEASAPHPPSACNRPPNDRSIRTHPGGREPRKAPCKMPKNGGNCTKVPDRGGEGVGEGISRKAFTPYGLSISALMHGG